MTQPPIVFGSVLNHIAFQAEGESVMLSCDLCIDQAEGLLFELALALARARQWTPALTVDDLLG